MTRCVFSLTSDLADMFSRSLAESVRSGHGRKPDVGVEADLVRSVSGQHRTAARLRDVAEQQPGQPSFAAASRASFSISAIIVG